MLVLWACTMVFFQMKYQRLSKETCLNLSCFFFEYLQKMLAYPSSTIPLWGSVHSLPHHVKILLASWAVSISRSKAMSFPCCICNVRSIVTSSISKWAKERVENSDSHNVCTDSALSPTSDSGWAYVCSKSHLSVWEYRSWYIHGVFVEYGGGRTFLIRKHCLNSFSWRSPAQQAKPKVCLYHRNPLNSHRESWEFNLSWQFLSQLLCFVSFLHNLFPRAVQGPGYKATKKRAMEQDRERRRSTNYDNSPSFSSPLSRLCHLAGNVCLGVCSMAETPSLWGYVGGVSSCIGVLPLSVVFGSYRPLRERMKAVVWERWDKKVQ